MKLTRKLLFPVLALAVALLLAAGLAGCGEEKQPEEKTVAYSVTVTCDDAAVLSGVGVQLTQNGASVAEKALENGTAHFSLPAGTYLVALTGVPEGYTYEGKTLSESSPSTAISLQAAEQPSSKVTYTVTLSCADEEALAGVRVRLMKGSTIAAEKAPQDGVALFELEADSYTVSLAGVPQNYTYNSARVTKEAPAATVTLTKKAATSGTFDLKLSLPAGVDVFGRSHESIALGGYSVYLFRSAADLSPAATAVTGEDGVAHFEEIAAGSYVVQVNGKDRGQVTVTANGNADLSLGLKYGSADAPLPWVLGANELPFGQSSEAEAYFNFQVEQSALYCFDADHQNANVTGNVPGALYGELDHLVVHLDAGTLYTFRCSTLKSGDAGGYTVTISKAEESVQPTYPWSGSGTQEDPFLMEDPLIGDYKNIYVEYTGAESEFKKVYFKYSPKADGNYTFTLTQPGDAVVAFRGAGSVTGQVVPFLNAASEQNYTANVKLTAGTDLIMEIGGGNDTQTDDSKEQYHTFVCSFRVTAYVEPEAPVGDKKNPDKSMTEILGTHTVTTDSGYYFEYVSAESEKYSVSTNYTNGITFTVRTELKLDSYGAPQGAKLYELSLAAGSKGSFTLEQGKTYYISVKSNSFSEGASRETFSFTVEKFVGGEADGSKDSPYPLNPVFGDHSFEDVGKSAQYYSFTLDKETEITYTVLSGQFKITFMQGGKTLSSLQVTNGSGSKTFTAQAGEVLLSLLNYAEGKIEFKLEQAGGETPPPEQPQPGEGGEDQPQTELHFAQHMLGEWKSEEGYTLSITETSLVLTDPAGEVCSVTVTEEDAGYGDYLQTVVWNGESYTLEADHMYGPAGGLIFYQGETAVYTFKKAGGESSGLFPSELQGVWMCLEATDGDGEELEGAPDLLIGADSITWGNYTAENIENMYEGQMFVFEMNGEQYYLMVSPAPGAGGMMLQLTNTVTGDEYIYAQAPGSGGEDELL